MKTKAAGLLFAGLLLLSTIPEPAFAKVTFTGLDLSEDNRLLFRADSALDGAAIQNALFISRLTDLNLQQITAFPEKMELLANGRVLQVRNAFGALRIPLGGGLPRDVPGFPCFTTGSPASGGRVEDMAASADGRWLLYVEPETSAYGNLILLDTQLGEKKIIAQKVDRPDRFFPACWSPDSRVFVYARAGKLYYYTVPSPAVPVDERYRLIGDGAINSVSWGHSGDFFYIRAYTVFRVRGSELFARAIYADFLEIGGVAGKIPFDFDSNFDSFWIAPDSQSILFAKGGRNIFYYPLEMDDFSVSDAVLPYVMLPQSCYQVQVLWGPAGSLTLLASVLGKEGRATALYRLKKEAGNRMSFTLLEEPVGPNAALSPDGSRVLCWGEKGIVLYDYANWRVLQTISSSPAVSCLWISNGEFVTGDGRRIERRSLVGDRRSLICLAGVEEYGFEEGSGRILARAGETWFATNGSDPWTEFPSPVLRPSSQVSGRYRVYLEPQTTGPYANIPMIRNTASVGTASLLPSVEYKREPSPREGSAGPEGIFTHGLRTGLREVALCFDLYDDLTGLPFVLDALNRFGFKATFFLNGEFIRRYPQAAGIVSEAGHEAASLFFAPIDLSVSHYRIGEDFVVRGLARNEDEFYQASGRELSLLWHPPYYAASAEIISAASKAGYRSSGRDVDPMDWVSREDAYRLGLAQDSAGDMIDRIIDQKRIGSIIPIRLGVLSGGRSDYLYLRINVLLDALVRDGYRVVPVSTLMEHAR
jgi:peptidoglycan/xylan/chitin deacetylase (PgdA/CDA1 family)